MQDPRTRIDGLLHPDFMPVARALREQLRTWPGGAAVSVFHRGECVVDLWGGIRDRRNRPWRRETMAPSFSTTKGVAATLVHIMADRGRLSYEDPVAKHWPEFASNGKQAITIRHVLAHQSGLYHIRQMIDHAERMLDWDYMVRAIEQARPAHPPGMRTGYHGLTFGFLVGELLRRVTGMPFPRLVQEELAGPLALDGLYVGTPPEALPRAAELIWPEPSLLWPRLPLPPEDGWIGNAVDGAADVAQRALRLVGVDVDFGSILDALAPRGIHTFDFGARETLRAAIPAANGLFTARSLARMYAALAQGGEIDGVRLLSRKTLREATRVQTEKRRVVIPFDMRWRLGYHGITTMRGTPRNAFGHFGFGGSGGWADPSRELAAALIVNSGMGTPFGDMRVVRVSGAVLEAVDRRSGRARPARRAREGRVPRACDVRRWALRQVARAF